jgi:hypothetical protein
MLHGRRIKIWLTIMLVVKLPEAAECATIALNQVDTFQGSTDNWTSGLGAGNLLDVGTGGPNGTGDAFLQVSSSGGTGADSKLITFNQMQWAGNFTGAGVGSVQMELKNFGTASLPIRITIRDLTGGQTVGGYSSTTPFTLPNDGQWHLAKFNLNAASLTAVSSPIDSLAVVLTKVADFRLLSSAVPSVIGDTISARIGIDAITALPPAPSVWTGAISTNWVDTGNWTGAGVRSRFACFHC